MGAGLVHTSSVHLFCIPTLLGLSVFLKKKGKGIRVYFFYIYLYITYIRCVYIYNTVYQRIDKSHSSPQNMTDINKLE